MSVSTTAVSGQGPGIGNGIVRECHAEWPQGGRLANPQAGPLPGPLSVSLWALIEKPTNAEAAFLSICTLGGPEALYMGTDESGDTPELFVGDRTITTGTYPSMGLSWHWFGYRTNGFGTHELYMDGALILRFLREVPNRKPFDRIVLWSATAAAQHVGSLASVKIFQDYRSARALIQEGKAGGSLSDPRNVFAWWPLLLPTDLTDHSGNGRHLVASSPLLTRGGKPPFNTLKPKPDNLPPAAQSPIPAYL